MFIETTLEGLATIPGDHANVVVFFQRFGVTEAKLYKDLPQMRKATRRYKHQPDQCVVFYAELGQTEPEHAAHYYTALYRIVALVNRYPRKAMKLTEEEILRRIDLIVGQLEKRSQKKKGDGKPGSSEIPPVESIILSNDDLRVLLERFGDNQFVVSVTTYHMTKGFITRKQFDVLQKIVSEADPVSR